MGAIREELLLAAVNGWLYLRHPDTVIRSALKNRAWPNVAQPRRYGERMLWRKSVDRSPQFITFSDKLATKDYMVRKCPDLPVAKTLWTGRRFADIPREMLAGDVFLKANHGCKFNHRIRGGVYDAAQLTALTERWLGKTFGRRDQQWGYFGVDRKLFLEEVVGDAEQDLVEFNLRASNGVIILGSIMGKVKQANQWYAYLDAQGQPAQGWTSMETDQLSVADETKLHLAAYLQAVAFTRRLSQGIDYARFDFFWNGRTLYGGEITVYPNGGVLDPANPTVHEYLLRSWDLTQAEFFKLPQTGWRRPYSRVLKRRLQATASAGLSPQRSALTA